MLLRKVRKLQPSDRASHLRRPKSTLFTARRSIANQLSPRKVSDKLTSPVWVRWKQMSRTAESAKLLVLVWKAGVLCPVGRTVMFPNCRTVSETSAKVSFTETWSIIHLSRSKKCGALCAHPCASLWCAAGHRTNFFAHPLIASCSHLAVRSSAERSGAAGLCSRPSSLRRRPDRLCRPVRRRKFTAGLMVTVLIALTASWFGSGNLHQKGAARLVREKEALLCSG
jgi:hypothetical protein